MILSHLHDVLFLPFEIAADYILPLSAFFLLVFSFLREFTRYAVFKVHMTEVYQSFTNSINSNS